MAFKMSQQDKDKVIDALSFPHGNATLTCDGHRVDLYVERSVGLNFRVEIYVDRCFKGAWCLPESTAPERKFLRPVKRALYSPTNLKKIENEFGKRKLKEFIAKYQEVWIYAAQDFASGRAAINHLCKVCDSISVEF
ncbi:MAG: hypothetical protein RLY58_1272 [Pseudomonadota bacterium]|jgi:hypothetical protein